MKKQFLKFYDSFVDDLFDYFYQETLSRDISKNLVEVVFRNTWDNLASGKKISLITITSGSDSESLKPIFVPQPTRAPALQIKFT